MPSNSKIVISILLFSCLFGLAPFVKADMLFRDCEGVIAEEPYITYPSNYTVYSSHYLWLNVSYHAAMYANVKYYMTYSLDKAENQSLPLVQYYYGNPIHDSTKYLENHIDGSVELPEISAGSHIITVYLKCEWMIGNQADYYYDNETVNFIIVNNQTPTPSLTMETNLPSPSPSPTVPEYPAALATAILMIGALASALAIRRKKHLVIRRTNK